MKKLLVLSVLLGLLALPLFAEHASIDFGGDETFGVIWDFGDNASVENTLTWDVIVGIDDYNSFTWSTTNFATGGIAAIDKALVTTDIGMWLGLPVGFKVMWGYDDPDANEFGDVSGYGNQAYDFSPDEYWGLAFMFSASFAEVELAFNPDGSVGGYLLAGLALKEPVPGLNAEVYYFQGGDTVAGSAFDQGQLGIGAAYATEVGPASLEGGVSFEFDLGAETWDYGVGLVAGFSIVEASIGFAGMEGAAFDALDATVDAAVNDMFDLYAGLAMSFDDAKDSFQGADFGAAAHIGAVTMYLGYLYLATAGNAGDYNATDAADYQEGGLYLKFDVDY